MRFYKMHGIENDYVFAECFTQPAPAHPSELARVISRPHTGVGSDGLILVEPVEGADARMRVFNADGSEAQMCGNGLRCAGKLLYDTGLARRPALRIQTKAGPMALELLIEAGTCTGARCDMGRPRLAAGEIPVRAQGEPVRELYIEAAGQSQLFTCVSMGNPHAVCFVDELSDRLVQEMGPAIESHSLFPERTNVEFCQVLSPRRLRMRVWERGSGETRACGTGACATLVAAVLVGRAERMAEVELLGGTLAIEWRAADGHVYMTGPAALAFTGEWPE